MTDNELNELFKGLSKIDVGNVGGAMEAHLRVAFRAKQRRKRVREHLMEIAATLTVAIGLYFLLARGETAHRHQAGGTALYGDSGFVLLPYGQNDVPLEHPVIVRVQLPGAELGRLGVSLPAIPKDARVEADLLVGQDGIARAVRVNSAFEP